MKIFVSYARVDRPYCVQILDTLEVHDIWYDQRVHAGQHWWQEILRRLNWCEGFIYLLSPESVESEYCKKEFQLAQHLGRHIFPVLIHPDTEIPDALKELQYADLSQGLTAESLKVLWNSIYLAEHEDRQQSTNNVSSIGPDTVKPPSVNPVTAVSAATAAMKKGQYDQAVFLLKRAKASGFTSRFVNIDAVLGEAEAGLERQMAMREADREYKQIADLVRLDVTRTLGCKAFHEFHVQYPEHDPENLLTVCGQGDAGGGEVAQVARFRLPLLEWRDVPDGVVELAARPEDRKPGSQRRVPAFRISRYPVTNAQFLAFIEDPAGYSNSRWWQYSKAAASWHRANPNPQPMTFSSDDRPRERVSWYEAVAFCQWLSAKLNIHVTLPTDLQWIRAARGDDMRIYPWGDTFDTQRCNTRESDIKMTTQAMRYEDGVSPFGVYDMAGNVWEWCLDATRPEQGSAPDAADGKRLVHGGSFISPAARAEILFRYYLIPQTFHSSIGFRLVASVDKG